MTKFEVQNMINLLLKKKKSKRDYDELKLIDIKRYKKYIYIYIERERERERGTILNVERWEENKMSDEEMVIF